MRHKIGLVGVALVFACGSDETMKDRLVGSWIVELNSTAVAVYTFNREDMFELDRIATAGSGVQIESHVGRYELRTGEGGVANTDGDYLFCSVEAGNSTCDAARREGFSVDFVGETLRLVNEEGVILLEPWATAGSPSSGSVTLGCFTDSGFSPSRGCSPGELRACAIAGDPCEAIQECNSAGSGYGPCVCTAL